MINSRGIEFRTTTLFGKSIGLIEWTDIETITDRIGFVSIVLKEPEKYVDKVNDKNLKQAILSMGIPISSDELEVNHEEMKRLLIRGFIAYSEEKL
jgi:hypothetical protein